MVKGSYETILPSPGIQTDRQTRFTFKMCCDQEDHLVTLSSSMTDLRVYAGHHQHLHGSQTSQCYHEVAKRLLSHPGT